MPTTVPERIRWAIDQLDIKGHESILEIGCGRGIAADLIAAKLTTGRLVAIDRSAKAIEAARKRNAEHKPGRVSFIETDIAGYGDARGSVDIVFAINVNAFWLDPRAELPVIRTALKPDGRLWLFYEPPTSSKVGEIIERLRTRLGSHDFDVERTLQAKAANSSLLAVVARSAKR